MSEIEVLWVSFHRPEIDARGYWDQTLLEDLFSGALGTVPGFTFVHHEINNDWRLTGGAIVVVPARHHASEEDIDELNKMIAGMPWCLLILTGDEEGVFPIEEIKHPNRRFWIQNPVPGREFPGDSIFLGCGYAHAKSFLDPVQEFLVETNEGGMERDLNWFFAGQVTNPRREQLARALKNLDHGELVESEGFGQGIEPTAYYWNMRRSKVVPAPSGPFTTDTFRAFEALEAGAVPLLDNNDPQGRSGVWDLIFPEALRPPLAIDWDNVSFLIGQFRAPAMRNQVFSKWQRYKRHLRLELARQLTEMGAEPGPVSLKTAVVVTSPSTLHPSTDLLRTTLGSIREESPGCEILVMFDGTRPEQKKIGEKYEEYVNRALHMINSEYRDVVPFVSKSHRHQSGLMRWALEEIRTPLVLFVEHDTPFRTTAWAGTPPIPWRDIESVVLSGMLNVARFHFESEIPLEHDHLMLDPGPIDILGVPFRRTAQWSQRPHLARADFYRWMMETYFTNHSVCMIEDCVLGAAEIGATDLDTWADWRIGIYHPDGTIALTYHADGRQGAPMYDMTFDYPGDTPPGAPQPGTRKVKD